MNQSTSLYDTAARTLGRTLTAEEMRILLLADAILQEDQTLQPNAEVLA